MADTLFDFGVSLDTSGATKSIKDFSNASQKSIDDIIDSVGDIETTLNGIKVPTKSIEKLGDEFDKTAKLAKKSVDEQKNALAQLIVTGKKGTAEFTKLETELKANIKQAHDLEKTLDDLSDTYEIKLDVKGDTGIFDRLKASSGDFVKGALLGGGVLGVLGGIGTGLTKIFEVGLEADQAMAKLSATTGKTGADADALRGVAENLFVQGFGDNLGGAIDSVAKMDVALKGLATPAEIEKIAPIFAGIAKTTGQDIDEITAKSRTFIQNYKGDVVDAVNTIAAVSQLGANAQEDVFDTLDEYSNLALNAGLSMQEFSGFIISGMQQGARDTDKLADAIKETGIRIKAGDYATAFDAISAGATGAEKVYSDKIKSILAQAEAGTISIADAMALSGDEIEKGVKAGEISKALEAKLVVAIAGTPAEDIGESLFANLMAGMNDVDPAELTESAKKAAALYSDVFASSGQGFEGLQRTLTVLAGDLGELLIPVLNLVSALLKDVLKDVQPLVEELLKSLLPIISSVMEILMPIIGSLSELLLPIITKVVGFVAKLAETLVPIVNSILPPLFDVLITIADAVLQVFDAFQPLIDVALAQLVELMPDINKILMSFADVLKLTLPIALKVLIPLIEFFINNMVFMYQVFGAGIKAAVNFGANLYEAVTKKFMQVSEWVGKVVDKIGKFFGVTNETAKATKKLGEETAKSNLALDKNGNIVSNATGQMSELNQQIGLTPKAFGSATGAISGTSAATKKLAADALDAEQRLKALNKTNLEAPKGAIDISGGGRSNDYGQMLADAKQAFADFEAETAQTNVDALTISLNALGQVDLVGLYEQLGNIDFGSIFDDLDTADIEEFANAIVSVGASIGSNMDDLINHTGDTLDKLALVLLDSLQKLVPVLVLDVLAAYIAANPIAGAFAAAGVTILLTGALSAAKSAVGAEDGGQITASYNKKAGRTDTIPMMLAPNEFVVNAKATQSGNNLALLKAINAGKDISTQFVGENGMIPQIGLSSSLNKLSQAGGISTVNNNRTAIMDTSRLEKKLDIIAAKIQHQEVSIVDRGRVEISDKRTIYRKQSIYR